MSHSRTVFLLALVGVVLLLPLTYVPVSNPVHAQTATTTPPTFTLTVTPTAVFAGSVATVSVAPENFSASSTDFSWYRNGVFAPGSSGIGKSSFSVATNPDATEQITIHVRVDPGPGFAVGEQSTTIRTFPNPATLIAEAQSNFTLEATVQNPNPGETVTLEVATFSFDKERADYQWYIDGRHLPASSGRGRSRIQIIAGPDGTEKNIRVDVTTPSGTLRSQSLLIRSASAPLYWWSNTAVPYWYRGKALPVVGAMVTILALPNAPDPNSLSYKWLFNGSVATQSSGVGLRTFSFPIQFDIAEHVEVEITDFLGSFRKTASVSVRPTQPIVELYELRPLRGIVFERALSEFRGTAGEQNDFSAGTFFFPKEVADALRYQWNLSGKIIMSEPPKPWVFQLTSNPGQETSDRLSVTVSPTSGSRVGREASRSMSVELR